MGINNDDEGDNDDKEQPNSLHLCNALKDHEILDHSRVTWPGPGSLWYNWSNHIFPVKNWETYGSSFFLLCASLGFSILLYQISIILNSKRGSFEINGTHGFTCELFKLLLTSRPFHMLLPWSQISFPHGCFLHFLRVSAEMSCPQIRHDQRQVLLGLKLIQFRGSL